MKGFTTTHVIPAKPTDVFAVLADLDGAKAWQPEIVSIRKVTDGPLALGSTWVETRTMNGKPEVGTVRVTEFTPGEAFAVSVDSKKFAGTFRFGLVQKGKGTEVTYEAKGRLKGLLSLFSGKLVDQMKAVDADLLERLGRQVVAPKSTKKAGAKATGNGVVKVTAKAGKGKATKGKTVKATA